jgi:quinolinate synthase
MLLPVLTAYEKEHIAERQPLPARYLGLSDDDMDSRITAAKAALGRRLVILGHHYQRDEVIKFADYTGDSFKLAGQVSKHPDADFIVFCGVHFMAESADVLSADHQQVILPDLAAGCSMADMADIEQLEMCWADLEQMGIFRIVPVTYINSTAAVKAFCGEHGGVVCTSSNAAATLRWAWERGDRILFLPDQHLGRNTAYRWRAARSNGRLGSQPRPAVASMPTRSSARMILWKGHCSVHTRFTVKQIENIRREHPGVRVIVHPEVPLDVVQAADDSGSTEYIIRQVTDSPAGSVWAVGTEIHLVNRLARQLEPDKTVLSIDQFGCLCSTMFRVSPNHLLWVLEGLLDGEVHNRIIVPDDQKHWTRVALDRMLTIQ